MLIKRKINPAAIHHNVMSFITLVLMLTARSSPPKEADSVGLACGLVSYYPFTGNADDESGNANHGAVVGAQLSLDRFSQQKRAYKFDGFESFIDIGKGLTLKMTDGVTLSVWVKPETFDPIYQNIVSDHSTNELDVGPGKILRLHYNEIQFHVGGVFGIDTAIYTHHRLGSSALGSWHHVVGIYDRVTINLFVDGINVDSRAYTEPLSVNTNPVLIGKSGFGEFFKGGIDEVRIYDHAISEDEIQRLYAEVSDGQYRCQPYAGQGVQR